MVEQAVLNKMAQRICPVCDEPMRKHSKHKLIVCKKLFKQRYGIKPATMTEYDDKGNAIKTTNIDDAISLQRKAVEDSEK